MNANYINYIYGSIFKTIKIIITISRITNVYQRPKTLLSSRKIRLETGERAADPCIIMMMMMCGDRRINLRGMYLSEFDI